MTKRIKKDCRYYRIQMGGKKGNCIYFYIPLLFILCVLRVTVYYDNNYDVNYSDDIL